MQTSHSFFKSRFETFHKSFPPHRLLLFGHVGVDFTVVIVQTAVKNNPTPKMLLGNNAEIFLHQIMYAYVV